ncbi:alpha/beta hydrolase [Fimbriiglobus ruber]|uniref:Acetyl esterase/lipase n=1 Tax=Fimbriiglobus ruber TaxID=1908690 RepID=A0A225DRZ8_9BACT|nr:alpha/beta hydrolase [Fimbriiglobus ruber]OWK38877.1 Acetyl esterase/lipase [Fimbriiglobus ruber]
MKPLALTLALLVGATAARAADPVVLDLWPGKPPGETGTIPVSETKKTATRDGKIVVTSLTNVSVPTLSVYAAPKEHATNVAVVVCPGGGYTNLAWDHEGEQVAAWLNSIGVTAAVLKYRVPRREGTPAGQSPVQALMDAQRAVGLVRAKAKDWGVDPAKIGLLGFSAGGHLTAWVSTNYDARAYEPVDEADKVSCKPDFAVTIYPGGVLKKDSTELRPELKVTASTPPTFLVVASDDKGSAESTLFYYLALKRAGVPAEMHIYSVGGHGFGLRPTGKPAATWPKRCEEWMHEQGILKK